MKQNKKIWTIVLIIASLLFIFLLAPCLAIYCGLDLPFIKVDNNQFIFYGVHFVSDQEEFGAMFLLPVLMMVPARFITLAIIKINQKEKPGVAIPG